MINLDELKKAAATEGFEISEDLLDAIAGGKYTDEEWAAMSQEERTAAQDRSIIAKFILHTECEMD
ncbi:MAG: hypothetical protein IJ851_07765 [Eubacterium sp.]|nr:hypothetical protein [Eubacterium sp.]